MCKRWRDGWVVGVLALCVMLGARPGTARAGEDKKPAGEALPADLARVPQNALMLLSGRVADLWKHPAAKELRKKMPGEVAEVTGAMEKALGVSLGDIERLSWVATVPQGREPFLFFVRTTRPYDAKKVHAILGGSDKEVKVGKETYHVGEGERALFVIDGRTFVVGRETEILWLLENPKARGPGPLAGAVRAAAGKHAGVLALNPTAFPPQVKTNAPPEVTPFLPLLEAESGVVTVDVGKRVTASLRISFDGKKKADEGAKPLQALVALMGTGLGKAIEQLDKGPKETKSLIPPIKAARAALKKVKVRREGNVFLAKGSVKVDFVSLAPALAAVVRQAKVAAARTQGANNLRQLALAMHNYHSAHRAFPPPAVFDKEGKAILSWRVLLLPYLGFEDLYKEFHLNEPWDSPHNKKLLAKMPGVFAAPTGKGVKEHKTFYQAIVGKGTVWDSRLGVRIRDILDGTSNTIMIVEGGKPVPWTKPADVSFDPKKKLPKLGGIYPGGFNAAFCDGSVHFLAATIKAATLRALITRAGGEVISEDF